MARKKTVLVVVAHADDLEFLAGGTVARFIDEKGYDVYEYILTDNSKGSYRLNVEDLVTQSALEAVDAGKILGLREVRLEGYVDGDLNQVHPNVLRAKIMAFIREVRADVVMGWDPWAPNEDHPDHRTVGMATYEAASFSGNPMFKTDPPHSPYPVTEAYWIAKSPREADLFVDISTTIDKKIEALLTHKTQMALTVDAVVQQAEALDIALPGMKDLDDDGVSAIMDAGMRSFCSDVGSRVGMDFAEQFRYQRLGMLDVLLGDQAIEPDF